MKKIILCFLLNFTLIEKGVAHEGHSHGSTPSTRTSPNSLDLASSIQNPLTFSLKARVGAEDSQYYSYTPGLFSYFGDEQVSTSLSYEFRFRDYSSLSGPENKDYDNNHKVSAHFSKYLTEDYKFSALGEGEQNRANTALRAVNNYNNLTVSASLLKTFDTQSSGSLTYQYGTKSYPYGTYSIPLPHQTRIGESISPSEATPTADEATKQGVEDAEHDFAVAGSMSLGPRTVSVESRYILNFSNVKTRKFTGQAVKASIDSPLWKRATLFVSQGIESRSYENDKQEILISELNLLQEINPKLSAIGVARFNQVSQLTARNWWEGYAQLQIVF